MMLPFTYDRPNPETVPLLDADAPLDSSRVDPVAVEWRPDVYATPGQREHGHSVRDEESAGGIPWHHRNVAEVRVQSRKDYELLHRVIPDGQQCIVRINPPIPSTPSWPNPHGGILIYHCGRNEEIELALQLSQFFPGALVASLPEAASWILPSVGIVVFCLTSIDRLDHLCGAISAGSRILTSDAGASEMYLCQHAPLRSWHCAHNWSFESWREMVKDLLGEENAIAQTSYVDQTPYIEVVS